MKAEPTGPTSADALACLPVSEALAITARGERDLSTDEQRHLDACLQCRAEHRRYGRLMAAIESLRALPVPIDPWLASEILDYVHSRKRRFSRGIRYRVATATGGVAAGAVATAGVIALAVRHRRIAAIAT